MTNDVALALVAAGTAVMVASSVGALVISADELSRVHFLAPVTSLGVPLVGAGVCVAQGWGLASGQVALIVGLLLLAGPVQSSALGRLVAQREGILSTTGPE